MVGDKWAPGMNTPFDPIAAKVAEKFNVNVHIIGKDLGNFENLLLGKKWVGTIIS
jgi:uridylate kinase